MKKRIKTETSASTIGRQFANDKSGTTAIEYTLIASGIGIAIIVSVNGVGSAVLNMFQAVVDSF